MLKRCFYSIPWGYFIIFSSIVIGIGVIALFGWLGFMINTLVGVIATTSAMLLDILIVPFGFLLGEEVIDYFKEKLQ